MSIKNAVVLCDGIPPEKKRLEQSLRESDFFIAADGGGNLAREFGLVPDLVVGDLDSYNAPPNDPFTVKKDPDQETTDLEKALHELAERQAEHVIVFGATGKRVDHTLKNFSLLSRFSSQFMSLRFRDNYCDAFLLPKSFAATFEPGTQISLFPISGVVEGITTKGLKYPLNNESLENGVRDGTSNEAVQKRVEIQYKKGDLLLIQIHNDKNSTA